MKLIKSLIIGAGLCLALSSAQAAFTLTQVVLAGTSTNLFPGFSNPVKISQASIASGNTTSGNASIFDSPSNSTLSPFWQAGMPLWSYTNAPYTNINSYATNYYTTWTNYYGVVQYSGTNVELIDVTNAVGVFTNYWPMPLALSAGTNNTVNYIGISAVYRNGMWATNSGTGPATVTITYQ